jgi:antitoxin component YwqK of YwqJK toxin-antitoxin module
MKNKLKSINNIPFLVCLLILLLNDFYLKTEYHNWLTGKLSDFCGLFVFASFWSALFPNKKQTIYLSTALFFVIWKSTYSQVLIDFFSQSFYPIHRVVDITDLIALTILPIAFFYKPARNFRLKLNPIPFALLSVFSFCATSIPEPTQIFEQPQYLIFKSGITTFESSEYPSEYEVYNLDSLVIVDIKEIRIDKNASIDDEFHKVQILKDIELRLLRESKEGYSIHGKLSDYEELRDSLTLTGSTSVTLKLDSITDHLNFKKTRLDGYFERFSNDNSLIIKGKYKNGLEDSIWTFYNNQNEIVSKRYFKNGELTRAELFEKSELKSEIEFNTRDETIRDKYFHVALLGVLIIAIIIALFYYFKKVKNKDHIRSYNFTKIVGSLLLPFPTLILAKFLSSLIPNSYPTDLFGMFGETILVFIILAPLYLVIFYTLKLRSWLDLVYYIFLLSLTIVFIEELIYLSNGIESSDRFLF